MPIRPENRKRYPKDWKAISAAIRERAGNRCEGSPDFPDCRAENGQPHPKTGSRVVLTVAHLDHTPENCEPENLKAMCQRCHLNYDKEHHARTAYRTRMDKAGVADMFGLPSNIKDQRIAEETMNCAHCGTTFDETKQIHICSEDSKPAESAGSSSCCYEALTVQALRMRNEVFRMGGMSKEQFTRTYLGGIGEYERKLAEREGIEI